jgi:hypothetical protein
MQGERKRLGEILRELQVLTEAEVDRVVEAMRRRRDQTKFGQMARDMGLLRDEHILAALAVQMQMFPGIGELSLNRVLDELCQPAFALRNGRVGGLPARTRVPRR